jgi:regulatory protein
VCDGAGVTRRIPQAGEDWFQRAVRYLARVDRTTAQVERFLASKGASAAQIKQVITRLSALRYLDDRGYAARWVESTLARRPMGRERLKSELLARGLGEALAEEVIDERLDGLEELTLARLALRLKGRTRLPRQRTISLLRQRGFEEETIERIIRDSPR